MMRQFFFGKLPYLFLLLFLSSFKDRDAISLQGQWRFAIDRNDIGVEQKWFNAKLTETVMLPGSMNSNGKGDKPDIQTKWTASIYDSSYFFQPRFEHFRKQDNFKVPFWLMPNRHYVGVAWYQKEFVVPQYWAGNQLELLFERVHIKSRVWVDGVEVGGQQNSLVAPHVYLIKALTPGTHTLTVRIDNNISDNDVGTNSNSVADHTQGNWNGIIGKMQLTALPTIFIDHIRVYPDVKQKTASFRFAVVNNNTNIYKGLLQFSVNLFNAPGAHSVKKQSVEVYVKPNDTLWIEHRLLLGNEMKLWSEFQPALYKLSATLKHAGNVTDVKDVTFGMREIKVSASKILLNDIPVFLRGDINNCEFPLTGFPPTDLEHWMKIFRKLKDYGFNHVRFHSWCPPEAAFEAADLTGFYLQPEGPTWPNHSTSLGQGKFIDQYIYDETNRMESYYGNHPSYTMLAAGNEPRSNMQLPYLTNFINYWKQKDARRIYTGASVAMSWPIIPANEYMIKSGSRSLNWNNAFPGSNDNYLAAIKDFPVPYITHELGQWCVFPNFNEIKKYTGSYKATNFEIFKYDLESQGMAALADSFLLASGKLQLLCYKYEVERSLRTPSLAGFQMLGLQDFPGQGTALVGVLDAFYEEKGYADAKTFSSFNNSTVPLARFEKFVYKNNETLMVPIELFHFNPQVLNTTISWTITNSQKDILAKGVFDKRSYKLGNTLPVGIVNLPLVKVKTASKLKLKVEVDGTVYHNDWDFWVFPSSLPVVDKLNVYETDTLDAKAVAILNSGGKVLLQAAGKVVKGKEVVQRFLPVFWNTSWFKMRPPHTTGLLINATHPVFKYFPTSYHSDLQWWEIVNNAQAMHLEDFPKGFRPIVQPIDTWFMNRRLGLIFEAKVGNGKLLVSSADLASKPDERIAARQLRYSMLKYMNSAYFNPTQTVNLNVVEDLFKTSSRFTFDAYTKDSPDELKPGGQRL